MRGEPATAGDVFAGMSSFLPALLVTIIVAVGVILGVMLLVVPAAVVVYLTLFVFHFVAYDKAGVGGSLSQSFTLVTRNFLATLVLFLLVAITNALGGAVMFGTLLTLPLGLIALTVAFEQLRGHTAAV